MKPEFTLEERRQLAKIGQRFMREANWKKRIALSYLAVIAVGVLSLVFCTAGPLGSAGWLGYLAAWGLFYWSIRYLVTGS